MAIASVSTRVNQSFAVTGATPSLALSTANTIAVGNHLILYMATDNSGAGGTDPDCIGIGDPAGNTWYRLGKETRAPGGVDNDGAHVEVWMTRVVVPYDIGAAIVPNFSFAVARGCFRVREFSGIRPISYPVEVEASEASSAGTAVAANPSDAGQLVIGAAAIETNLALVGDSDTVNGSWSAISSLLSNSGVDATSMTLAEQYKIVTAGGAQNWSVSYAGAHDYAALAIVLDTYVPAEPDFVPGNPNYPCIAGSENLSYGSKELPLDTGTTYMFNHRIFPNDLGSQDYAFVASVGVTASVETDPVSNHTIIGDLYLAGNETPINDPVNSATLLIDSASSSGEVWDPETEGTGSDTELEALATVGGDCIKLESGQSVEMTFDTSTITTLFPGYRIVRWGLRYVAFKDDSEPPGPTTGIQVFIKDSATNGGFGGQFLAAGWLVNNYRGTSQYETRWFGEVNANPRAFRMGLLAVSEFPHGAGWTPADFANMASGELTVEIMSAVTEIFVDYVEAVVELAPERRVAHGTRTISTAPYSEGLYPTGNLLSRMVVAADGSQRWVVDDTDSEYVLAIREALPASPSDLYPLVVEDTGGDRTIPPVEAVGPAVTLTAVIGPRTTLDPPIRTGVLSRGVLVEELIEQESLQAASVTALDGVNYPIEGSFFPSYVLAVISGGVIGLAYSGEDVNQGILVPGGQQYDRIKLLVARGQLTTADLDISVEQPAGNPIATATITVADVDARPWNVRGFTEISVPLDVPITPTAGRVLVVASSGTEQSAAWRVGGAIPAFFSTGYDVANPDTATEPYDYSIVLECPLAAPTYTLGTVTEEIVVGTETCTATSTDLPEITLTNADLYDHVSIKRSIDGGDLVPVALLHGLADDHVFVDYEVPWDVESGSITYVITGYRNSDHLSVSTETTGWLGVSTAPGAAFGLFSNQTESGFAYIPVDGRELEIEYSPLSPVQMIQRHGVDYQVALMAPEERGYSVSVTIIAERLGMCVEGESPGITDMSPDPFEELKSLERNRRMMLKLPGGHARYVHVKVNGMTVRVQRKTYMAEITLTDAEIPSVDPWF